MQPRPDRGSSRGGDPLWDADLDWHTGCSPGSPVIQVLLAAVSLFAAAPAPPLPGVEREVVVRLPKVRTGEKARILPGRVAVQIDVDADVDTAEAAVADLPEGFDADVWRTERGSRVRIHHRSKRLRAASQRGGDGLVLVLGAEAEQVRLRELADQIRRPLPEPRDLGAYLELWRDAEAALAAGELRRARRLWEKLSEASQASGSRLADLASLRIAELYAVSGHIAEALARLRSVSRRYPRTAGAALARLDVLHLEAIIEGTQVTPRHIELAAATSDRPDFEPFTWLRGGFVLAEAGQPNEALAHFPDLDALPEAWRDPAARHRNALIDQAIAVPVLRRDPAAAAIGYRAWESWLADHPRRLTLLDLVTDAQSQLGLFGSAVELLRERLRSLPSPIDEAELVTRLARSYRAVGDATRGAEVLAFQIDRHPNAPALVELVRSLAVLEQSAAGLPAARARLSGFRKRVRTTKLKRAFLAIEADLLHAFGKPAAQVHVLSQLKALGYDDKAVREPALAVALAQSGRAKEAAPLLRKWIGHTHGPQARDRLAYHLAAAELDLGQRDDARKILEVLAKGGTRYAQIARTRLRELSLRAVLGALESATPKPAPAPEPAPTPEPEPDAESEPDAEPEPEEAE